MKGCVKQMINISAIKTQLGEISREENFSGVVLISKGEEDLISYASGLAHRGFKVENQMATRFDTASITKLFTAVSIFTLIEKGKLTLEDRLFDHLDLGETVISRDVTLQHLLTHTSGIGDDADEEAGESYEAVWRDKPCYGVRELKDFLPQFIYRERNFEPGEACRYNNCAFILLGLVIEKISGLNYKDFIQAHIFDKANMNASGFFSMDGIEENVAEGYAAIFADEDDEKIIGYKKNIYSYPPVGGTDGGAYTTAADLKKFINALLNGKLLSKEWTDKLLSPQVEVDNNDKRSFHMAYGFEITKRKSDNQVICIRKEGSNAGVACDLKYYTEADTLVTILSNTDDCDIWKLAFDISRNLGLRLE